MRGFRLFAFTSSGESATGEAERNPPENQACSQQRADRAEQYRHRALAGINHRLAESYRFSDTSGGRVPVHQGHHQRLRAPKAESQ